MRDRRGSGRRWDEDPRLNFISGIPNGRDGDCPGQRGVWQGSLGNASTAIHKLLLVPLFQTAEWNTVGKRGHGSTGSGGCDDMVEAPDRGRAVIRPSNGGLAGSAGLNKLLAAAHRPACLGPCSSPVSTIELPSPCLKGLAFLPSPIIHHSSDRGRVSRGLRNPGLRGNGCVPCPVRSSDLRRSIPCFPALWTAWRRAAPQYAT